MKTHTYPHAHLRTLIVIIATILACSGASLAQWSQIPAPPFATKWGMNVVLDGKLYLFGGDADTEGPLSAAYVLNLSGGTAWSPIASMPQPRFGGYAAAIDGKIYIVGGTEVFGPDEGPLPSVLEYDPVANTYVEKAPIPSPVAYFAAAVVGTKIYVIGGENGAVSSSAVQVYDAARNQWSTSTQYPITIGTTTGHAIGDDIYVVGGLVTPFGPFTAATYRGRVQGNSIAWTPVRSYPTPICDHASGVLGGALYVAAGNTGPASTDAVHRYDPGDNIWTAVDALPVVTATVGQMPNDGESLYFTSGFDNRKSFKLTPTIPAPILDIGRSILVATVKKGPATELRILEIANKGSAPLEVSVDVPASAQEWIALSSASETVVPGGSATIGFTIGSPEIAVGVHKADVVLRSNDPARSETTIDVRCYVVESTTGQPTNAVVEVGTGNWCGYCPEGHRVLAGIENAHGERAIVLEYHGGAPSEELMLDEGMAIVHGLGLTAWPSASFQRWQVPGSEGRMSEDRDRWADYFEDVMQAQPTAPVAIMIDEYAFDDATRTVTATLRLIVDEAMALDPAAPLRLSAIVKQRNIRQAQVEITSSGTVTHNDYMQQDVVRLIAPDARGAELAIPPAAVQDGVIVPGTIIEHTMTFPVNVTSTPGFELKPADAEIVFVAAHNGAAGGFGPILQGVSRPLRVEGGAGVERMAANESGVTLGAFIPNPARDIATLEFLLAKPGEVDVALHTMRGETVMAVEAGALNAGPCILKLDVASLPQGAYIVEVRSSGEVGRTMMRVMR
jgi:Kelch motif/Galactose oxidase, central domain